VAAVLVQLERQGGYPGSGQGGASYAAPVPDATGQVHATRSQREGIFREMKLRARYEKPSERRAREAAEAVRRARKSEKKRIERDGF